MWRPRSGLGEQLQGLVRRGGVEGFACSFTLLIFTVK